MRQLRQLERERRGTAAAKRISLLLMLKSDPDLKIVDAAARLGHPRRTAYRWLEVYRASGLAGLLGPVTRPGRPRRLGPDELKELQSEMAASRIGQLSDVQEWLRDRFGLEFSGSGVWYMVRRDLKASPRGWVTMHDEADRHGRTGTRDGDARISQRVIEFLNALPPTGDVMAWVNGFREALAAFLGDVDRISINVNTACNLGNPGAYAAGSIVTQHVGEPTTARGRMAISVQRQRSELPSSRLLSEAGKTGFPVEHFHEPACFDYYFGGEAYIGSILLWRNRVELPISSETLESMNAMEPFILFALSDVVARNRAEEPVATAFRDALDQMTADADLSAQEQRIVILQLMGHSYKEMADLLSVTVDTVKKHFKQIHRKTRTRSQSELFAKYFTVRLSE